MQFKQPMIVSFDKNTTTTATGGRGHHRRHLSSPSLSSFSSSSSLSSSSSSSSSSRQRVLRRPSQPRQSPPQTLPRRRSLHSSTTATTTTVQSDSLCCSGRFGEVAGVTAAECAVIWCCCPLGLVNLLILAVYKVPAGLCQLVLRRKRKQRMIKQGLLPPRAKKCQCGCDDTEIQMHPASNQGMLLQVNGNGNGNDNDNDNETPQEFEEKEAMVKLEKEMWERFYNTGFWRSPSRSEHNNLSSSAAVLRT